MCICIDRVEQKLTEKMIELNPGCEVIQSVEIQNKTFLICEGKTSERLFSPVLGKCIQGKRVKKFEVSMNYSFCPYCGEKY